VSPYAKDVVCYYYEPVKAPLLRDGVLPALRDVAAGTAAHLERGWLHGPHVRVRLAGLRPDVDAAALALSDRLCGHLRGRPSRAQVSHAALLARAVAAGRAELVPPPYEPVEPDNTVRITAADTTALARLLGSPATVEVRGELLRVGVPAVEATLEYLGRRGDTAAARVRAAVIAMTVHAAHSPRGLDSGYLSFRSHLESFLHHNDPAGQVRARHNAVWLRHADEITGLVEHCAEVTGDGPAPAAAWRRWTTTARRLGASAHDRGELSSASPAELRRRAAAFGDPPLVRRWGPAGSRDLSDFHRMLGQRRLDETAQRQFDIGRFCVNVLYLLLAVGDVTPAERYLAASLVSEAVERLCGQTWRERFGRTAPPATSPHTESEVPR
jgi:hypothetical protein